MSNSPLLRWFTAFLYGWVAAVFALQINTAHADPLDILGIRLGDELALAEQRMQTHFGGRDHDIYFLSSRSEDSRMINNESVFTDGLLFVSDLRSEYSRTDVPFSEMLIVFFDDRSEGDPVISVSRIIGLHHYSMTVEDVELGTFDKYGQPGRIRNWNIAGTDYMWARNEEIHRIMISEPRDWDYIRDFEENCASVGNRNRSDFRPEQINDLWRNKENEPLPIGFSFSSQEIHRFGELQREIEGSGWSYMQEDERIALIEANFQEHLALRRECGETLFANIDLWRMGGPGQRAFFFLYDQNTILDVHERWAREVDLRSNSGSSSAPIDF